jgi:hypothetical protein
MSQAMAMVAFLLDENVHGALAVALVQRFPGRVARAFKMLDFVRRPILKYSNSLRPNNELSSPEIARRSPILHWIEFLHSNGWRA